MPETIVGRAEDGALFLFPDGGGAVTLRRAVPSDARALAELRAASLAEQAHLDGRDPHAFSRAAADQFGRLFADGKLVAWLLCDADRVVGSACAVYFDRLPFADGTVHAEVCGVYVAPAYRGRGHASSLIDRVVVDVRRSAARKTFLRPASRARALYARLGFIEDATGVMSLAAPGTA